MGHIGIKGAVLLLDESDGKQQALWSGIGRGLAGVHTRKINEVHSRSAHNEHHRKVVDSQQGRKVVYVASVLEKAKLADPAEHAVLLGSVCQVLASEGMGKTFSILTP